MNKSAALITSVILTLGFATVSLAAEPATGSMSSMDAPKPAKKKHHHGKKKAAAAADATTTK